MQLQNKPRTAYGVWPGVLQRPPNDKLYPRSGSSTSYSDFTGLNGAIATVAVNSKNTRIFSLGDSWHQHKEAARLLRSWVARGKVGGKRSHVIDGHFFDHWFHWRGSTSGSRTALYVIELANDVAG